MPTWIIPAAITVVSFAVAFHAIRTGPYEPPPLWSYFWLPTIVSLASWLVWSLV